MNLIDSFENFNLLLGYEMKGIIGNKIIPGKRLYKKILISQKNCHNVTANG